MMHIIVNSSLLIPNNTTTDPHWGNIKRPFVIITSLSMGKDATKMVLMTRIQKRTSSLDLRNGRIEYCTLIWHNI